MVTKALVLSGGNALGSYHGGVMEALLEAGEAPSWIASASIGAITAALIAGSPPEARIDRLRSFWREVSAPNWLPASRRASQWLGAASSRLIGRPELFRLRLPLPSDQPDRVSLYDSSPMRRTLARLIDFERVNSGEMRLSVLAVDLRTGAEVVFDTAKDRIGLDHIMASAGLIPDFPPVQVEGRWLVDGGLGLNTPVDLVLEDPPAPLTCFVSDLFPLQAELPRDISSLAQRQSDLIFAHQTERALHHAARGRAAGPRIDLMRLAYAADAEETAMKAWDFSATSIDRRWEAGRRDTAAAIATLRALPNRQGGLQIHPPLAPRSRP